MKRILSMLLVLCMVVTMLPMAVFAEELTELGIQEVSFEANAEPCVYTYTAEGDGTVSVNIESVTNEAVATIELQNVTSAEEGVAADGVYTVKVTKGDEVRISVGMMADEETFESPAATVTWYGNFTPAAGGETNPIMLTMGENAITVAPGATVYYSGRFGGMILTAKGESGYFKHNNTTYDFTAEGVEVTCVQASMWDPCVFAVTNDSEAEATYTLTFAYPQGSQMNPEVVAELNWYYGNAVQAAGDYDGYYYTYTATADGITTFYFGFNEGLENYVLDIAVSNNTSYVNKSLLMDGVDNYGLELQMPVKAGDVLVIQVIAVQDAEGNYYPAAEMSWCGNFSYPIGSEKNPCPIEWVWDDAYINATASVNVAAGETVYYVGQAGMILTVNGEKTEMNDGGNFSITNSTDAEATYALALATPVGSYNNPEVIDSISYYEDSQSLAAEGSYNYIWTATEDTSIVLDVTEGANITADVLTYVEDSDWPISEQFSLAEPDIDENWNYNGWIVQENLILEVKAGQEVKIQVNGLTDWETWTVPAVEYTLSTNYAPGTVKNPIGLYEELTNTVTNSGTKYYQGFWAGMNVTVSGAGDFSVISEGETIAAVDGVVTLTYPPVMGRPMPSVIGIVGDGEYTIAAAYPVGHMDNPAVASLGNNTADIEANVQGYFLTYTAEETGKLFVTISGADQWTYTINNLTSYVYGDTQWSDSDPVVNPAVIEVNAGDQIQIIVNSYDKDSWDTPAATLTVNLAYDYEAKIGDKGYISLAKALAAAKSGEVVTLVKDVVVDGGVVLPVGVSMNLVNYSLTADYFVGFNGSYVTGDAPSSQTDLSTGGSLYVPRDRLVLADTRKVVVGKNTFDMLPIWDNTADTPCYRFTMYRIITDGSSCGLKMDLENEMISFYFQQQLSGTIRKSILADDGGSNNGLSVVLRMEWNVYNDDGSVNGTANQDFIYSDKSVQSVSINTQGTGRYTFKLVGYSALNIDSFTITPMVVTESGAVAYGEAFTYGTEMGNVGTDTNDGDLTNA